MKITCKVIEDLMQQYADNALSEDSRHLVEEHLEGCADCREKMQQIRSICEELDGAKAGPAQTARAGAGAAGDAAPLKDADDYGTLKRFRRWLNLRRAVSVVVSVLITFGVVICGWYLLFHLEGYMPYDKTGMRISEEGMMYMDQPYYGYRGVYSGEDAAGDMIEIFCMTDTFAERHWGKPVKESVVDFGVEDQGTYTDEDGVEKAFGPIDKVYYLPEKYVKERHLLGPLTRHNSLLPLDAGEEENLRTLTEIEKNCILVWERNE